MRGYERHGPDGGHAGGIEGEQPVRKLAHRIQFAGRGNLRESPQKTGGVGVLGVSVDTFREACPPSGVRGRGERPVARPAQSPQVIGDGVVVACALAEDEATHEILATVFSEICSPAARRSAAIRGEPYVPPESR
jgi:hypothetical protein